MLSWATSESASWMTTSLYPGPRAGQANKGQRNRRVTGPGMWDGGSWMQGRIAEGLQQGRNLQVPEQMNGGRGGQREHWVIGHRTDGVTAGLCLGGLCAPLPLCLGVAQLQHTPFLPSWTQLCFFPKRPRTHLSLSISSSEQWGPRRPGGRGGRLRGQGP